jgi:putrescine transport system substrate-binding protein
MSDSSNPPPTPPRDTRRLRTWSLAAVLSVILILGWAAFLTIAPPPEFAPVEAPSVAAAPPPSNQLRVLAWRNAIDDAVLEGFTADTGIAVVIEGFDTTEQLLALASGGGITQDLVLVSGIGLKALIDQGALQPVPKAQLTNIGGLDPALAARAMTHDAGNTHAVPLLWGTIGLAFNAAMIADRLGPEAMLDSWSVLFDPAQAAKLADCGVQVIDTPTAVFPTALKYLGLPPDSAKAEDTEAAARLLENIRPSVAKFSSRDVSENLAMGRVCLAMTTSGDAFQARDKARAAGLANDIRYVVPKEAAVVWFDFLAIPKGNADTAHAVRLIDFLLRPGVAARLTNAKGFGNTVTGANLYVKPEIKTDAALLPDLATLPNVIDETAPPPAAVGLRNRFWQLINGPQDAAPKPAPN